MAELERERKSALFTVATSVMSGLVLAFLTKALQAGISAGATVVWSGLVSFVVAAVSWAVFAKTRRPRQRSRTAFLMTSAFDQKYYLAELVQRVQDALDGDDIEMVLKVPGRDYDASAQSHHLRRIQARKQDYLGGIIVAGDVSRLRDDLRTFCRDSRLPVVFADVEPFSAASEYPDNSAYIGYDTDEIGELAGRWLARRLRGEKHPRVLIIASREHRGRQRRCEEVLRSALPDVKIQLEEHCEFRRSLAYSAVRAHIRQLAPGDRLDAIFCTNDEMALGAGNAVELLGKMHRGDEVPKRTILRPTVHETH